MSTINEVVLYKTLLRRKALDGSVLIAPHSEAALTDLVDATGALTVPPTYKPCGKISNEGVNFSPSVETSSLRGLGSFYDDRIDVTSETLQMTWSATETNLTVLQAFFMLTIPSVATTANSLVFDKPETPVLSGERVLSLFKDVNKATGSPFYFGHLFTKGNVMPNGDQTIANDDNGVQYPLQASATMDSDEGTPMRVFFGGPGFAELLTDMGLTAPV